MLYFALVYPRILYAIELYANTYLTNLHDLMILNNRILRILQHQQRTINVTQLFVNYNTLPINKLFQFQILQHAHTLLFNIDKLPKAFNKDRQINSKVHLHDTRTKLDFHRVGFNSTIGTKVSLNLCAKMWNSLPTKIKTIASFHIFKRQLKSFLFTHELQ